LELAEAVLFSTQLLPLLEQPETFITAEETVALWPLLMLAVLAVTVSADTSVAVEAAVKAEPVAPQALVLQTALAMLVAVAAEELQA
jgi:hypothetical protein